MKPGKITLFFACVIVALAFICAIFPSDGITVGKHSYYLPTIHDLAEANLSSEKTILDSLAAEAMKVDDSISGIQTVSDSSDIRFWLPDSLFFDSFWEAAEGAASEGRIVRILHYGDSQIEMDRMTSQLRLYMQETFGGGGPGMIPFRTIIPTLAVSQSASGALTHLSSFGDSTVTRSRGNYGPMMQSFRLGGEATVRIKAATHASVAERVKAFSNIRLVYNNRSGVLKGTLTDRGHRGRAKDVLPLQQATGEGVGSMVWALDSATTSLSLSTHGAADLYCITIDNGPGVAVDNIPMRGCSGQQFTTVKEEYLTGAYAQLDVGLIILQFGGNSVPYLKTGKSISTYCRSLGKQIDYLHRCCPGAKILFVGPSDMSTRHKGVLQSYPMLPVLIDSLVVTANSHGAAYWSIYHAMGGWNSMVQWNKEGLAGSDYIHFSQRGADIMGQKLAQAFADNYHLFSLRRRLNQLKGDKEIRR